MNIYLETFFLSQFVFSVCVYIRLLFAPLGPGLTGVKDTSLLPCTPRHCICGEDGFNWSGIRLVHMG